MGDFGRFRVVGVDNNDYRRKLQFPENMIRATVLRTTMGRNCSCTMTQTSEITCIIVVCWAAPAQTPPSHLDPRSIGEETCLANMVREKQQK
jgi:hypothetical protein